MASVTAEALPMEALRLDMILFRQRDPSSSRAGPRDDDGRSTLYILTGLSVNKQMLNDESG